MTRYILAAILLAGIGSTGPVAAQDRPCTACAKVDMSSDQKTDATVECLHGHTFGTNLQPGQRSQKQAAAFGEAWNADTPPEFKFQDLILVYFGDHGNGLTDRPMAWKAKLLCDAIYTSVGQAGACAADPATCPDGAPE